MIKHRNGYYDARRPKLLCNNTMKMYIKRISLVRYMIVLSCAKMIFLHQKKKISHIINKQSRLLSPVSSPICHAPNLPERYPSNGAKLRDRFKSKFYRFSRIRAPMGADYVSSCICDREFPAHAIRNLSPFRPVWQLYRSRARFLLITFMFARPYRRGQQFC